MSKFTLCSLYGCLFGFFGAVLGILGGIFLPAPFYQLTNPEILKDGQWGMIYLASIPFGTIIGASLGILAGVIIGLTSKEK